MAVHAEHALTGSRISQVLNLPLAIPTSKAAGAVCLVAGENGEVLNLISTGAAAIRAVVANEGAIAEQKQIGVRV